jgi:hypothetical protein
VSDCRCCGREGNEAMACWGMLPGKLPLAIVDGRVPGGALSRMWDTSGCDRGQLTIGEASKCVLPGAMVDRSLVFCLRNARRAGRNTHAARLSTACQENSESRAASVGKRENERQDARPVDGKSGRW